MDAPKSKKAPPMRHCYFCGEPMGAYADYDRLDTCGKSECERDARDCAQAERDEAHARLDSDMGWDR